MACWLLQTTLDIEKLSWSPPLLGEPGSSLLVVKHRRLPPDAVDEELDNDDRWQSAISPLVLLNSSFRVPPCRRRWIKGISLMTHTPRLQILGHWRWQPTDLCWSPDGSVLALVGCPAPNDPVSLYHAPGFLGTSPAWLSARQLLERAEISGQDWPVDFAWSRAGGALVLVRYRGGGRYDMAKAHVWQPDTAWFRGVCTAPERCAYAAWSSCSRWFVLNSQDMVCVYSAWDGARIFTYPLDKQLPGV